jgi:putative glutathione S-transferase
MALASLLFLPALTSRAARTRVPPIGARAARTALDEVGAKGEFTRTPSEYRETIEEGARYPPEAGRYHLHVALACPWADGVLSMLYLKGLENIVSHSVVHPTWGRTKPDDPSDSHTGWLYRAPGDPPMSTSTGMGSFECDDALVPDTVTGTASIRDAYAKGGDTGAKFSTPLLVEASTGALVNNESGDLLRILNRVFDNVGARADVDLFPADVEATAAELHGWIYPNVLNGVYRCGFARTQESYEAAESSLFESLERLDGMLASGSGGSKFLTGDRLTWVDLRLFHTLVRFDPVYTTHFKTNRKRIADYANLPRFVRDVYAFDGVRRSVNMRHIKMHYYSSHPALNPYGIVPAHNGLELE